MKDLTERQQQTLDFIRHSITRLGYPPTLREIGMHMKIRSTNGVNDHLRALERKGYLWRDGEKSRALRIAGDDGIPAGPALPSPPSTPPPPIVPLTECLPASPWAPIEQAPSDEWILLWSTQRQWVLGMMDPEDGQWALDSSSEDVGELTHFMRLPDWPPSTRASSLPPPSNEHQ